MLHNLTLESDVAGAWCRGSFFLLSFFWGGGKATSFFKGSCHGGINESLSQIDFAQECITNSSDLAMSPVYLTRIN